MPKSETKAREENAMLRRENKELKSRIALLEERVSLLTEKNELMKEIIVELKNQNELSADGNLHS